MSVSSPKSMVNLRNGSRCALDFVQMGGELPEDRLYVVLLGCCRDRLASSFGGHCGVFCEIREI